MTRSSNWRGAGDHRRPPCAIAVSFVLAVAMLGAAPARAARDERPLVLEPVSPGVWRADARGMTLEFRRGGPEEEARLTIRFVGASGDTVAPPTARRVTLTSPGAEITFEPVGQVWVSTAAAAVPRDGSLLSIVEADHHHDFRLNVHGGARSGPPGEGRR